jgi:hypothetical protein
LNTLQKRCEAHLSAARSVGQVRVINLQDFHFCLLFSLASRFARFLIWDFAQA